MFDLLSRRPRLADVLLLALLLTCLVPLAGRAATLPATPTTLAAVLGQARGGDTIALAPGPGYMLALSGKSYSPSLTITGPGAVFSSVNVFSSAGVTLQGFEISSTCPAAGGHPNQINGSKSVRVEGLVVHGNTACWSGLLVRDSSGVVVTANEFYGTLVGLSRLASSNIEISRNRFHDLQSDGTNGGCGDNILITANRFTDFRPAPGDHPDAIQAWTTACKTVSTGLTITDNLYVRGSGDLSTVAQGVFVNHDAPGDQRYAKVKVAGNVSLGGMYNGVAVSGADGVEISGNIVAGFPDMESWIRWSDNTGQVVTGNRAQNYIWPQTPPGGGVAPAGNTIIPVVKDAGAAILAGLTPPPAPVPSPAPAPAPADTRDAQIATLTAKVADLAAQIATLRAQGAAQAADLAAAQGKAAQAAQALSTALQDLDQDRAALAAIRGQAQGALDSNPATRPPAP